MDTLLSVENRSSGDTPSLASIDGRLPFGENPEGPPHAKSHSNSPGCTVYESGRLKRQNLPKDVFGGEG